MGDAALLLYDVPAFDAVRIGSQPDGPNFQGATTAIDLGAGPFARVTLHASLESTCFPFERWSEDPPPTGERWPPSCDAFDRNYEYVLDPPEEAGDPPGLELVRAITPFGGPLELAIDVTDVANARPGPHRLRVTISTWSDASGQVSGSNGGWDVTAHLAVEPGPPPRRVLAALPLFDGSQTSAAPLAPIGFEVPAGTTHTTVEYRATGHGGVTGAAGCALGAPAEEFCPRAHSIWADGVLFTDLSPWRGDCASLCSLATQTSASGSFEYCAENPCGAIESVRASRSNWCPGSVTPPALLDIPAFQAPGAHELGWVISDVADGGSWRISAMVLAYGE